MLQLPGTAVLVISITIEIITFITPYSRAVVSNTKVTTDTSLERTTKTPIKEQVLLDNQVKRWMQKIPS